MIDHLVDYDIHSDASSERYDMLAKLGFDAVPQLIEHLNDDRLTRGWCLGINNFGSQHIRVGDVVSALLSDLGAPAIGSVFFRNVEEATEKDEVTQWWKSAQKLGEEAYLLERVIPPKNEQGHGLPDRTAFRLIGLKYPKKLPAVFREILEKRPDLNSVGLSGEVAKSALSVPEKVELLKFAIKYKAHRGSALHDLSAIDNRLFSKLLTTAIEELPNDYLDDCMYYDPIKIGLLVMKTDDPAPWQSLEKYLKPASLHVRMMILTLMPDYWSEKPRHRLRQLRLLFPYLDDSTIWDKVEVRTNVAVEMASLLRIEIKPDVNRRPEAWATIRKQVREAAEKELAKEKTP